MKKFDCCYSSAHYDFYYHPGSFAEREVADIAQNQERCFQEISLFLGVVFPGKIRYYLCDTPQEVGDLYGDGEPCNGFARYPDQVFAVYNKDVQCIGPHEDAHLLSYQISRPDCPFLREGLAMYFDKVWWSVPNEDWCRYYQGLGKLPSLESMLNKEVFFETDCRVSYPMAGFFVQWFLENWGKEKFLSLYSQSSGYREHMEKLLNGDISWLDKVFRRACREQLLQEALCVRIERLLKA